MNGKEYQRIFLESASEIFVPLFAESNFEIITSLFDDTYSFLVFKKGEKYIRIHSFHEHHDQSFFNIIIGEKFNSDINDFEGYYISLKRLNTIINGRKDSTYYSFPFGKKQTLESLEQAKKDFIQYASFYLDTDVDLFDKILKLKGIRK